MSALTARAVRGGGTYDIIPDRDRPITGVLIGNRLYTASRFRDEGKRGSTSNATGLLSEDGTSISGKLLEWQKQ